MNLKQKSNLPKIDGKQTCGKGNGFS